MRKKSVYLRFLRHFRGLHKTASNSSVPTLEIFAGPRAPQKCLLGSSPNPLNFWTLCPEVPAQAPVVGGPELTLLGLIFLLVRVAEQVIDISSVCGDAEASLFFCTFFRGSPCFAGSLELSECTYSGEEQKQQA